MPAIQTIIETYIRFADAEALLALRAHRLKLLATSSEGDPFFKSLRSQCIEEISAIEAGLARLRAAAAPSPGAAQSASPGIDHASMERTEIEPAADPQGNVVAARPDDVAMSDHVIDDPGRSGLPGPQKPRAVRTETSDPTLIASSVLAASLATRIRPGGTNLAAELVELQRRLTTRLKR